MGKRKTLIERIDDALDGKPMGMEALARILYPDKRSWRYQSNGGPPGLMMALGAALRRGGFFVKSVDQHGWTGTMGSTVYPRAKGGANG